MPAANVDPSIDFDNYEYKANELMLFVPVYNTTTKKLAYITVRGDLKERFWGY